jgi:voltage-gated potassium channel
MTKMAQHAKNNVEGREAELRPSELFMLMLCVFSLLTLALQTFVHLPTDDIVILDTVDNMVCGIFLIDFLIRLTYARDKLQFFARNWIDLASSIPAIESFRAGRIVRVIRMLRVLRGIRIARTLAKYLQNNRADGTILAAIFVSILLLLLASVAILQVEQQADGSNIKTPSDSLWWAVSTMTTVGYGDKYPVTTVGRVIAAFVMIAGVGLFGTLSGSVTSWILNPMEARQEVDFNSIQSDLATIHLQLNEIMSLQRNISDPQLKKIIESWPDIPVPTRHELERFLIDRSNSAEPPRSRNVA